MARRAPALQEAREVRMCHQSDGRTIGKEGRCLRGHLSEPLQGIRWEGKENGCQGARDGEEKMSSIDVPLQCLGKLSQSPNRLHRMELHP